MYESTQLLVTYLLESNFTDADFKQKILTRDSLKFYLVDKNRYGKFDMSVVQSFKVMRHILKPMSFKNLIAEFGHMTQVEIAAGSVFRIPLDIQLPGSILCISFQTVASQGGDIQFGLYMASDQS